MGFLNTFRSRLKSVPSPGPLAGWNRGALGVVEAISTDPRLDARLREMGIVPGAHIRLLRGGCPLVIQVEGTRLCMRQKDASGIQVRSLESRPNPTAGPASTSIGTLPDPT